MNDHPDASIARIAAAQHGLVTVRQAEAAGLSPTQIRGRVGTGRWQRAGRGVYRIGGVPRSWQQTAVAAVLARRSVAAISHLTAAAFAGLSVAPPPKPSLTVPSSSSGRSSTAVIHRRDLPPDQLTKVRGILTTTGARTLVDCAEIFGPVRLPKLVDEAMHLRLASAREVEAILDANRDVRLITRQDLLRDLIDVWLPTIRPGSPAEARLLRSLMDWGFPVPERQIKVVDADGVVVARLDGGWTRLRLGFEYDSVQWHGPAHWASDEHRHALVQALGWTLIHVDKADIAPGATRLRDQLVTVFAQRSHQLTK